ncbi:Manganese transport system membrane protein MntB [Campylobacter majalis]|uniref:Manganese transport system membrane protein MntB n=1 Tax=Campylobacter majalis TaxID=2790656 RepID=A0ABN7K6L1_9BACT|nr:metal ABC transporter permease [Campylobacter majalis]CAD7288153.1 Manganese transport system membrane protein MntB [Campylobacter majalis]
MLEILSMNFMQNALLSGILVSVACGIIGSLVVINKMGFIAGGIAHGAYGGIGIAFFLGFSPLLGASAFSLLLAIIIAYITLKDKNKIDSVIGAIWAFGMAFGIVLIDLTPGYNVDLMSYLFGSILTVSDMDILFMLGLDIFFIAITTLLYRQFVAISFDMEYAKLKGIRTNFLYYVMVCMMALCVVATIRVVGLILVIALLSIAPLIAAGFTKRLGSMMVLASIISAIFCILGLMLSYYYDLTSGASIILIASICFFVFAFLKRV